MISVVSEVEELLQLAERTFAGEDPNDYELLDRQIRKVDTAAREAFQAHLRKECQRLVEKLEKGISLTSSDRHVMELWIIEDAKYYIRYENDFENWKNELERLIGEIKEVQAEGLDRSHTLLRLQAHCKDARNILPDINFYLREKERVKRFEIATWNHLNRELGHIMADILRAMITSDKM